MQLFYSPEIEKGQTSFTFDKDESKHIIKVLRRKMGDLLYVTNGKGTLFTTKITLDSDKKCVTEIIDSEDQAPTPFRLHLAVAPTKMNERYEWFLEKATEIGIHEITPIICDHSERKIVKTERFEKNYSIRNETIFTISFTYSKRPHKLKRLFKSRPSRRKIYCSL